MKTLTHLILIVISLCLINCESPIYIEAGVLWSDDAQFSEDGDWYLALSEGCYSNCEGATLDVIDQAPLEPNKVATNRFVLGSGSKGNVTAFVFLDTNENGIYDDGYDILTGYKYNFADTGESTAIAVSAYF